MLQEHDQNDATKETIPAYLKISIGILIVILIYLGYVFWSRAQQKNTFAEREAQKKAQQAAADERTVQGMGGDRFDILNFYASPPVISRGDSVELCYGVSNAKSVTLEPQSSAVWPAFSKCVPISPRKTTAYTLTATDAAGHTKRSKVTVEVR